LLGENLGGSASECQRDQQFFHQNAVPTLNWNNCGSSPG
jgi:hypothetical protein